MASDPRRAIVERREQVAAEPRPVKLSHTDLADEVAAARDADDLYRIYRPEWVIVFVAAADRIGSDADGHELVAATAEFFASRYSGRVRDEDVRHTAVGAGPTARVQLQLRLPNLKGEFKTEPLARAFAAEQGWDDATVVARNGKADHELRAYGVKKLPA